MVEVASTGDLAAEATMTIRHRVLAVDTAERPPIEGSGHDFFCTAAWSALGHWCTDSSKPKGSPS